jgi:hypothetical protein
LFFINLLPTKGEVCSLAEFTNLTMLSFVQNPIVTTPNYRLFVIHVVPSLKVLDFNKVKHKVNKKKKKNFYFFYLPPFFFYERKDYKLKNFSVEKKENNFLKNFAKRKSLKLSKLRKKNPQKRLK